MDDLSPEARALLDEVRGLDAPSSQDKARVRSALALQLGAASASAATLAKATATSSGKVAFLSGLVPKIFLAVLALGAPLVLFSVFQTTSPPPPKQGEPASLSGGLIPSASPAQAPSAGATEVPSGNTPAEGLPTEIRSANKAIHPAPSAPVAGKNGSKSPAGAPGIDHELKLLTEARKAMRDGDSQRALKLLEEHQKQHPGGTLSEERSAARVVALCQSGKGPEARAEAARFLLRYPSSPLAVRVREACP